MTLSTTRCTGFFCAFCREYRNEPKGVNCMKPGQPCNQPVPESWKSVRGMPGRRAREHSWCPRCGVLDGPVREGDCEECLAADDVNEAVEYVVYAADHRGAVEALREAIAAARLFNRSGMTWLEYDAELVRLERIANSAGAGSDGS